MNEFTGINLEEKLLYQAFLAKEIELGNDSDITFDVSNAVLRQGVRVAVLVMSRLRNR